MYNQMNIDFHPPTSIFAKKWTMERAGPFCEINWSFWSRPVRLTISCPPLLPYILYNLN
jgi:hypothetical protein